MSTRVAARYMIRQKVLKILGAAFYITDDDGQQVGFCNQKAFKLKEDIRLYTDETKSKELLSIKARSVIDFGATYDVYDDNSLLLGSARRKGLKSMIRDEWLIFDDQGQELAKLQEDGGGLAFARRILPLISYIAPQKFNLVTTSGQTVASYETMRNIFIYKLSVTIYNTSEVDDNLMLALGFLLAAIEGRQGSNNSGSGLFSGG